MAGYTRQNDGDIQPGQAVSATPLKNEFDTLESAFNGTTGHSHDGSTGNSPQIDLTTSVTGLLPIANGGTNAATASDARTNLGVAIGTDVQAYDAGLQSISGLTTAADTYIYTSALDTYTTGTITAYGRSLVDDVDAATARGTLGLGTAATVNTGTGASDVPTITQADARYLNQANDLSDLTSVSTARTNLGVAIGADVQAHDVVLDDISGLILSTGQMLRYDGVNMVAQATGATGLALLDDATAGDARTTLGLGSAALLDSGTAAGEVRTNSQNDAVYQGLDADLTTLAGITVAANEMYARASTGNLTTITVYDWFQSAMTSTDAATFRSAIGVTEGGTELQASANLSDVQSVSISRTNLGLGTAAVLNQGTGATDLLNTTDADARYVSNTSTLTIANGGTGATTALGARTNLGLGTAATEDTGTAPSNIPTVTDANGLYCNMTNNLSDLTDAGAARTNLGLGTIATQAANSVSITGGTISGVTYSGTYNGLPTASTTGSGIVQLNNTTSSTSTTLAATANVAKLLQDDINTKADSSHTHAAADITSGTIASARLPAASTVQSGIVQLNNTTSSTDTAQAATANAVKTAYDLAATKADPPTSTENGYGTRTVSTSQPSGGSNGDIWYVYD